MGGEQGAGARAGVCGGCQGDLRGLQRPQPSGHRVSDLVQWFSQPFHTGTCLLTEFITRKSKMANGYSSCRTSCLYLTASSSGYSALLPMERSLHSFNSQASETCVISRWLECTTSCSHGGGDATRCFLFDDILLLCAALLCLRSDDLLWYRSGGVSKSLHIGREVSKRKK